ncbi:nitrogen regulatory P-II family protein [Ralstonia insidiosa]|uniref:Nitrogen regulatory P-II family protein n=1 Tax=Ralstonia insidiosa TaxID=190721 RepID=A0AAC9BMQ2_9RALS|nr:MULTISPECIES: P-II family nitrogen regulator [Ralstonia]ANH76911.1 nitrogen regulatory P-II family protein [Ralstonia insidiosa]EPX99001.1 transcriptional regulator [Ralstonia sp. AU12-08]MBY4705839.1 P-II family nitrogen regulator [Ralstonia insidiosa]GAQ26888.1 nitrogen regulatory protein P-II [Ralstonia sp. NT80]
MKEIRIVVRPQLLERLHEALRGCPGFPGMTVGEVNGYPPVASQAGAHSIKDDLTEFVPRVRIELVVSDALASMLFDAAVKVLEHGQTGDSAIWMTDVVQATFLHRTG